MVVDEGEPMDQTALDAQLSYWNLGENRVIKEGAGPELICTGAGGDTGLGDERSMTEVSVKEQMKKLVG
ncbi:hypothetical protein Tco_1195791 [Tanacetum coccineum]